MIFLWAARSQQTSASKANLARGLCLSSQAHSWPGYPLRGEIRVTKQGWLVLEGPRLQKLFPVSSSQLPEWFFVDFYLVMASMPQTLWWLSPSFRWNTNCPAWNYSSSNSSSAFFSTSFHPPHSATCGMKRGGPHWALLGLEAHDKSCIKSCKNEVGGGQTPLYLDKVAEESTQVFVRISLFLQPV
jgi:hypothetical protein